MLHKKPVRNHDMTDQPDRILRIGTVLDRTGLTRSTLYRKIASGSFPRQVAISARCAVWRESAVKRWMMNPMFYSVDDDHA
jgi:prophage regulatory protein